MLRLKELRQMKEKTQEMVAQSLGIPRVTYCNYESGTRQPDIDMLQKMANYFDISIDGLISANNEKNIQNTTSPISKQLKALRQSKNITQRAFAEKMNVSLGAIAMWETDKRGPDIEMLCKIANYFNVTIDYLLGRSEQTSPAENDEKDPSLTKQEQSLIDMFRSCDIGQRGQIIGYAKAVCDDNRRQHGITAISEKKQA